MRGHGSDLRPAFKTIPLSQAHPNQPNNKGNDICVWLRLHGMDDGRWSALALIAWVLLGKSNAGPSEIGIPFLRGQT
jgi:hypothetical protein